MQKPSVIVVQESVDQNLVYSRNLHVGIARELSLDLGPHDLLLIYVDKDVGPGGMILPRRVLRGFQNDLVGEGVPRKQGLYAIFKSIPTCSFSLESSGHVDTEAESATVGHGGVRMIWKWLLECSIETSEDRM
jgi:hypothetical protein